MKRKMYYQIANSKDGVSTDVYLYGEITSFQVEDDDSSCAKSIVQDIGNISAKRINLYIDSPGGEISEACAIASALRRHPAEVWTYGDGFIASAATIPFCAGDHRIMNDIALMFFHNGMASPGFGNAKDLRKAADDVEKMTELSIREYMKVTTLSEQEVRKMMEEETWLNAEESLAAGFATEIDYGGKESNKAKQSFREVIKRMTKGKQEDMTFDKDAMKELIKEAMNELLEESSEKTEQPSVDPEQKKDITEEKPEEDPEESSEDGGKNPEKTEEPTNAEQPGEGGDPKKEDPDKNKKDVSEGEKVNQMKVLKFFQTLKSGGVKNV